MTIQYSPATPYRDTTFTLRSLFSALRSQSLLLNAKGGSEWGGGGIGVAKQVSIDYLLTGS